MTIWKIGIGVIPLSLLGRSFFYGDSGVRKLAAWWVDIPQECIIELREHSDIAWVTRAELDSIDLADSDRSFLPLINGHS